MAANEAGSTPVVIGPAAAPLRRALSASAWCALECLVARSHLAADGRVVEIAVRELAADLGCSKNTAQRALGALAAVGVLTADQSRRADGTFRPGTYQLHLPTDVLDPVPPRRTTRRPSPTPSADTPTEQLSLLGT